MNTYEKILNWDKLIILLKLYDVERGYIEEISDAIGVKINNTIFKWLINEDVLIRRDDKYEVNHKKIDEILLSKKSDWLTNRLWERSMKYAFGL